MNNTILSLFLLVAFTGLDSFTTSIGSSNSTRTKIIRFDGGSITAQMLDNGLTLVSWTPLEPGGGITVSVTNMSNGLAQAKMVSQYATSTTFAGLQTEQLYRFSVENARASIIIIDVIEA